MIFKQIQSTSFE